MGYRLSLREITHSNQLPERALLRDLSSKGLILSSFDEHELRLTRGGSLCPLQVLTSPYTEDDHG